MKIIILTIVSYLIGCFSSAFLIGKVFKNIDIRHHGSGNSGATNALRVMGFRLGALTFAFDVLKGIVAVLIGRKFIGTGTGEIVAGLFAILGHNWPIFIKFKGGKGVATSVGVLFILNWISFLPAAVFGVLIIIITRYVSLGSMGFLLSNPIFYLFTSKYLKREINKEFLIFSVILAMLSIIRHRENIIRLINGNENKLGR